MNELRNITISISESLAENFFNSCKRFGQNPSDVISALLISYLQQGAGSVEDYLIDTGFASYDEYSRDEVLAALNLSETDI